MRSLECRAARGPGYRHRFANGLAAILPGRCAIVAWIVAGIATGIGTATAAQAVTTYLGTCDASAAVALDDEHFVVASDEDNTLRIYRRGRPAPLAAVPLAQSIRTTGESDLEGAARVGDSIYWISSHGRNSEGKIRKSRYRMFVTEVDRSAATPTVKPPSKVGVHVLDRLLESPLLLPWRLQEASRLAPEAPGGLNIEGLAATAEGHLLIGFRNPVREGKALAVTLRNPRTVVDGGTAVIGRPVSLDLGGRGIRSIERIATGYLVVGGPTADRGDFVLYRWSGAATDVPQPVAGAEIGTLRPEAVFAWPGTRRIQVLSDDGGVASRGIACKDRPPAERSFRSVDLEL